MEMEIIVTVGLMLVAGTIVGLFMKFTRVPETEHKKIIEKNKNLEEQLNAVLQEKGNLQEQLEEVLVEEIVQLEVEDRVVLGLCIQEALQGAAWDAMELEIRRYFESRQKLAIAMPEFKKAKNTFFKTQNKIKRSKKTSG
ncbi:MAG: hypothetical protein KTR20_00980 [Cellvibrionaceae bacterium]|nr:hypothetical protein [Cellvibrionaceae bacterium]